MATPAAVVTLTCCCTECHKVESWVRQGMSVSAAASWCVWSGDSMSSLLAAFAKTGATLREPLGEAGAAFCSLECMDRWAHRVVRPGWDSVTLVHLGGGSVTVKADRSLTST